MKNRFNIVLIVLTVFLLTGVSVIYYVFNKPHRNIEIETPAYVIDSITLIDDFNTDEKLANQMYVDQVILVSGTVTEFFIDSDQISIFLNNGISCELDTINKNESFINALAIGDQIKLKGKCDGFDMIMGVVFTRCFIVD
jgi:hypothetical protein